MKSSHRPHSRIVRTFVGQGLGAIVCALLALTSSAQAMSIYDASVVLSVSAGQKIPFGTSLDLFPGITVTPPPVTFGNATATRSAVASVPGQVSAAANGIAFGSGGEQSATIAASAVSAFGFGSLLVPPSLYQQSVKFPLVVQEDWSIFASAGGGAGQSAEATIRFLVLLDGTTLHNANRTVTRPDQGGSAFASNHGTTPVTVDLEPGFHSLLFSAEASGLAATPEPGTLLLVGTTAAGLGLARWRQRRRKQAAATP